MNIVPNLLSVNHKPGRVSPYPIDLIVIHVMEGSMEGTLSHFRKPASSVSAHYGVSRAGEIVQYVDEADTAWHAGRVDRPTAAIVRARPNANPNGYSIGIEHEGTGRSDLSAPQRAASIALIRDICARRGIPIDRQHIVGHHEIFARKSCPGKIDVDRLVRDAMGAAATAPQIVWSSALGDYLIVTRAPSDLEWYYVPRSQIGPGERGSGPLHQMPRHP